jgi:hypothetical protein
MSSASQDYLKEIEDLFDRVMQGTIGPYYTRYVFAWDRLAATEGRPSIPVEEMTERLSKLLNQVVTREEFFDWVQHRPESDTVLEANARVLEVDKAWLIAEG